MANQSDTAPLPTGFAPIYVIFGKDRRLVMERLEECLGTLLADTDPQLALSHYEGPTADLADVLDTLRTVPFLSAYRVVVIKEADVFISRHREPLEAYLDKPSATGILILVAESFPANTRLAKKAAAMGEVIACQAMKTQELPAWLARYAAERYHLALPKDAAWALIELAGEEPGMLMAEVDKLAAYIADPNTPRKQITPQDIHEAVGNNRQINVFHVIDAMTQGNVAQSLNHLNRMLAQDRNAEYTVVGAFAWHIRRLYDARLLFENHTPAQEITRSLRIWTHQDLFLRQVRQLGLERIGDILKHLMRIDLAGKTGGNIRQGLECLIVRFCQHQKSFT